MYGIINELARQGKSVTLISNAKNLVKFDTAVSHIYIDYCFSPKDKRIFQGSVGLLPLSIAVGKYAVFIQRLRYIIQQNSLGNRKMIFFEYLDNTIGYVLKRKGIIAGYINDLHGIATVEFKFQADHSKSFFERLKFSAKYYISNLLDTKVFNNADGFIFASAAMQKFYVKLYPKISVKKSVFIPYVLSPDVVLQPINTEVRAKLVADLNIRETDFVILFAGAFKKTGGVPDLIEAVSKLVHEHQEIKLLLVGEGATLEECKSLVKQRGINGNVHFIGRTPYENLRTYQDLATIIVCPDKMNIYSDLIIHVKYLDALMSGKIVVNGAFKSVKEVNVDDSLSVSFEPSNIESLAGAIDYCARNLKELQSKYQNNPKYTFENLTYSKFVGELEKIQIG